VEWQEAQAQLQSVCVRITGVNMASQEEDNKLECISNVNKDQERYFLNVYKKHEYIFNNKNESFEHKISSLIDVWKSVGDLNLSKFDIRHVIQIVEWAKLHALNIVLTAEWNTFKATHQSRLLQEIEKAQCELLKLNAVFASRCKKLADVVKNPWEDAVLMKLMKTKDAEIGPEEIEFFCVETAYVISVRLNKLCESQCEDLALNLVTAFMNCHKLSKTQNFSLNATEIQMWFIFDIYIALLYKFQERQKIVVLLKELTFEEGLQLVRRFAKKRVKISKIWKNCHRVAILATQMYISQAVVKYSDELKNILESYMEMYISLCNTETVLQDFPTSIRRISNLADAAGLYVFCDVIRRKAGTTLKTFVIEMYIRALTTDMNELERQKDANEQEKVTATTSRLAKAFCNLADFLDEHVKVARECVLTAFSLEPTKERLKHIEELAKRSGFQVLDTGQEWKCKLHPPVIPSDDVAWICPECGDWMCKPQLNIPLKINMALNEALQNSVLGISEALCDDLVVCLSNPRYQILSWFLPWEDLHRMCIMYLQDPQTTKNFITELKFIDIDYSIFKGIKREPLDELAGIERGYEQYLDQDFVSDEESNVSEDSMSQESRPYSLGSDGAGEGPYFPLSSAQSKSDPNTLKSLRMFRPNLKRPKNTDPDDNRPGKLRKGDSNGNGSNIKTNKKTTLNKYLNGISKTGPTTPANSKNQASHPKNVKAATLPSLGGQVAKKQTSLIQVKLQPQELFQRMEKNYPSFKNLVDQALKPYNQSTSTISESTKRDLMLKLLNRHSLNGSKENNNYKQRNANSLEIQTEESIKNAMKTSRELKALLQTCHTLEKSQNATSDQSKTKTLNQDLQQVSLDQQQLDNCTDTPTNKPQPVLKSQKDQHPPINQQQVSTPKPEETPMNQDNSPNCLTQDSQILDKGMATSQLNKNKGVVTSQLNKSNKDVATYQPSKDKEVAISQPNKYKEVAISHPNKNNKEADTYQLNKSNKEVATSQSNKSLLSTLDKTTNNALFNKVPAVQLSNLQIMEVDKTLVVPLTRKSIDSLMPFLSKSDSELRKNETYPLLCKTLCSNLNNTDSKDSDQKTLTAVKEVVNSEGTDKRCNTIGGKMQETRYLAKTDKMSTQKKLKIGSEADAELFSDLADKSGFSLNGKDNSNLGNKDFDYDSDNDDLPKNINLTENIRTYTKKPAKRQTVVNEDCVNLPCGEDKLDFCKNVNSSTSKNEPHSNVQKPQTNIKELKIVLYRLPSTLLEDEGIGVKGGHSSVKLKCDRGKIPPRNGRRRKSADKSENKPNGITNRVQNHKLLPLQDVNPRVTLKENSKNCDETDKTHIDDVKVPRVLLERISVDNKSYARSVLANVPGLNDYQMMRPTNVNHIVNVVQVSGGRTAQTVPMQTTQTSTQVSPHIQRIGQPRVADQKPEHSNSNASTTTLTSASTTAKTTTTQPPSTLINILSQQIIRPVAGQSNTIRRQTPLINILSQQIIRPSVPQKVTTNAVPISDNDQAFGKSVYQNNTEVSTTPTNTVESPITTSDNKKNITTKAVPVNVQPIQGSVIYSRQVPVGQTISLIPPGGTTRQVFRIATSNPDQISLVKDSVIHSKMSALLAAALQGRQKSSEEQPSGDDKITLTRPTLVQNARIVKPVQLQIPTNIVRAPNSNLSSTTLEQLREFDMVYKQIKERSSSTTPAETSNSPPENQEVTQQRISVTYVNQLQKYAQLSPVVVVSSYSNLQPAASPALSVTSQGSSSPCVTPAPTPTLPKIATKSSKGKTLKNTTNNTAAKSSPIPKPQQKPQEDEHTTQRIFDILAEYAEQLRNSPDLNNKPAPRRRSNPPTNPSQNSKQIDADDITVGSEDSSGGGIVQLSVTDDEQSQAATVNTPESTENSSPSSSRQQLILTENSSCTNQSRNLIIADSSVGEALKMPNTAVIVPGSYIMPVSMVKGGQQIAVVSGGSKILATVPARSGQNMLLFQSFMNQNRKGAISAVKYSTIQPISGISSQSLAGVSAQPPVILPSNSVATAVALGQPLTLKKLNDDRDSNELLLTISPPKDETKNPSEMQQPDSSTSVSSDSTDIKIEETALQSDNSNEKIFQSYQKSVITNSVATSVIATTSTTNVKEENPSQNIINMTLISDNKAEPKSTERMQSVLVTACSSNGPMLSHMTPRYRKPAEPNITEQKNFRSHVTYYTNKTKKTYVDPQKIDEMQKQAAMERELRLQKSLSEECEDLGVDEPSTSDLFPEADLLFDSNHSPSFDQAHDIIKRTPQSGEVKEVKAAMNLFSDDETSSSLRTDLFEYVEYQTVETELDYQARQLMNGTTASNESGSSGGEDNTLLPKCATMSEVTLNSPISPELYTETSLNKYKFKYSNRKKGERAKVNDVAGEVVSSSEDTVGSSELGKINCEDDSYKVVHVAITKADIVKEERKCELHCDEDLDSPSGRGARRSVRKLCSCCNGSQDGNISRKRPHSSRPQTPASPHKKAFLNKKR
ncbi:hypothetical protein NQ315_010275, partial [Exocentrus adspersus]